eukprot:5340825-Amphidinium_carterae.1
MRVMSSKANTKPGLCLNRSTATYSLTKNDHVRQELVSELEIHDVIGLRYFTKYVRISSEYVFENKISVTWKTGQQMFESESLYQNLIKAFVCTASPGEMK